MLAEPHPDALLVAAIRRGEADAWNDLIAQYEGRLLAFVESRLRNRATSEDVVQETFVGFLASLPNFDERRPLESWLFTIAGHKLTDCLRREGRRPAVPLSSTASETGGSWEPAGSARGASSIVRSGERRQWEDESLAAAMARQFAAWRAAGDWQKIKCMELLFVAGAANKTVAHNLGITEQQVANFKFDFVERLRKFIHEQRVSEETFPELAPT